MDERAGYPIPLDIADFFEHGSVPEVDEERSIQGHLHLLLITAKEEYAFDPEYGCELWEHDFSTEQPTVIWVDRMADSIKQVVMRYEPRLAEVDVKADIDQVEFKMREGDSVSGRLKRRIKVVLRARLTSTNELFRFEDVMLVAPFSLD